MQELMSLLHAELPQRVPHLDLQGQMTPMQPELVLGDSLQATLTFVPNGTHCWLLSNGGKEEAQAAGGAAGALCATYTPLPYTLLLRVEQLDGDASDAPGARHSRPIEGFFARAT
mmetsp:Transcript_50526/g.149069  ORF Transcript_50526/g.149069 Transcript_50526/m.149069 type:complete len:115 (-) Transcript_50526:22-366(-)